MLELLFDVLLYTIPRATGRAVVYVFTLGRASGEDWAAEVIGVVVLLAVFATASLLVAHL